MTPSATPQRPHQRRDAGAHVLVVEDVSVTREFLKRLLLEGGYRVSVVGTATEALAGLTRELPDLVVLDLLLPDFNGLDVCRFLRSLPDGEDIPVLIITVDERPNSHAEALAAGADDFLRKPLLPTELQSRVRSLIRLRRLRVELRKDREAILTLQDQKNELVQFLVHDLNNMLASLLCGVELLEYGPAPQWLRQRQRIEETTRSMQGMVQSMLDLSLHDQAGLAPNLETITLGSWLGQAQAELEAMLLRRNQTLTVQMDPDIKFKGDSQMLQRMIGNLLDNASKFGPTGSEIQVTVGFESLSLMVQVADLGSGIPEDKKLAIFERFIRLEARPGTSAGRGLGLAFCRMVAELHGGRIWVEDNEPHGSRFIVALPMNNVSGS